MYKKLRLSGVSVVLLAAAFSFTSCEKEVVQNNSNNSDNSVENAESDVQTKSTDNAQYPEVGEFTYYESFEEFSQVVEEKLMESGSLVEETGNLHAFPVTNTGVSYGVGEIVDLGSNFPPSQGTLLYAGIGHIAAQYAHHFGLTTPCQWLQSQSSVHYVLTEADC